MAGWLRFWCLVVEHRTEAQNVQLCEAAAGCLTGASTSITTGPHRLHDDQSLTHAYLLRRAEVLNRRPMMLTTSLIIDAFHMHL
jgi:hypothetical protein